MMNKLFLRLATFTLVVMGFVSATAQDKHFTQFYASPLNLNPALAGSYNGKYRIGVNYRDQWRSALDTPVSTYAFSGDLKYELGLSSNFLKDYIAIGLNFFSDRVANYDLNTNQVALNIAYHKGMSRQYEQYLSIGYQIGVSQKNVNYENMVFEDQFNNIDGYTLATGEMLPRNNFGYADMALGLNYSIKPADNVQVMVGTAIFHFNSTNVSFWRNSDDPSPGLIDRDVLHNKYNLQLASTIQLSNRVRLMPRLLFASQGGHWESNIGTNVRFAFNSFTPGGFYIGSWIRPAKFEDTAGLDAIVLFTGVDYGNFLFGLSYDANFSDLVQDQRGLGAFELSITFLGLYENDSAFCPEF